MIFQSGFKSMRDAKNVLVLVLVLVLYFVQGDGDNYNGDNGDNGGHNTIFLLSRMF